MSNFYASNTPAVNSAMKFQVTDEIKLRRFLILGCENGTYYANGKTLLDNSLNVIDRMISQGKANYIIDQIVEISTQNKSRKNDQLIAALIKVFVKGDNAAKAKIIEVFTKVCRTGTHFFLAHAIMKGYVDSAQIGWGNNVKALFATFFDQKTSNLTFQMMKYRNRENWSWKDSLRLNHIKPVGDKDILYKYVVKDIVPEFYPDTMKFIEGFEKAKVCSNTADMVKLISDYNLPEEMIPTQFRTDIRVQEALMETMGVTAILRHLGAYTASGLITQQNTAMISKLKDMFTNHDILKKARIHPLAILDALKTYGMGKGLKGSLMWKPVQKVADILDDAFYMSFDLIEPTNKKFLFAMDVSVSMFGNPATNVLNAAEASAALVMSFIRTESDYLTMGFSDKFIDLQLTPKMRLEEVLNKIGRLNFGSTNIGLPFEWAQANKLDIDAFVVTTDNEVNRGSSPSRKMIEYATAMNKPNCKFIINATSLNDISVADPNNRNMMDMCGFSSDIGTIMSEFVTDKL